MFSEMRLYGERGETSVQICSKIFVKKLKEGVITTKAGRLLSPENTLRGQLNLADAVGGVGAVAVVSLHMKYGEGQ